MASALRRTMRRTWAEGMRARLVAIKDPIEPTGNGTNELRSRWRVTSTDPLDSGSACSNLDLAQNAIPIRPNAHKRKRRSFPSSKLAGMEIDTVMGSPEAGPSVASQAPHHTVRVNNLNEKVKLDGKALRSSQLLQD